VQGVDVNFGVFIDDPGGDDDRSALVSCSNSVNTETTGETGDGSEETLKRLGQVMRDVVFVYLEKQGSIAANLLYHGRVLA
jgi:hypothetical protein